MPRFKHYNYDQDSMVVINYQEQLQPGTFEHAVHYLIEHKLDLTVFHPKYRNDDTGRLAYDPAILLKIILFAYSKGITSSREIQWCCETNIIFKALSCDTVPHFTTLAKFVSQHADEIEELFEQILLVCHEQGLLGNELIDAQAFGEGQEHHTLKPVLETVQRRYKKLGIADNIYQTGAIVTADTGFANEANMKYLHERQINGYIPDNRFRSRDPKFAEQKEKYGKRSQTPSKSGWKQVIPASEFQFDPVTMTCILSGELKRYVYLAGFPVDDLRG